MRNAYRVSVVLVCAAFCICFGAFAQNSSSDEAVLRQMEGRFLENWARADGTGLGTLFAEDADLVIPTGLFLHGREEIGGFYSSVFAEGYKGSKATADIVQIRMVQPGVAVIDGMWSITGAHTSKGEIAPAENGIFSMVAVKQNGTWLIAALREQTSATELHGMGARK